MGTSLNTNAEKWADESRNLPGFRNLSLPGIKEQVAQMLALIGRQGIFSTYTIHDISHIDAMLGMLDWLIPESTKNVLTPIDWLLIVLSIYLHDLGMVTAAAEFEHRLQNTAFMSWLENLAKTEGGREYVARTNRMSKEEKERFFFQEFIRGGHAQRIREWVTGRHTQKWGPHVEVISKEVAELLKVAPPRFRDYLGVVCESHHREDLDKTEKYPLVARFGNHPREIANVQYAAILLRTTDLLHVTKDRTPSIMYQTIQFSDPKSVDEWDKQQGTFAVGPIGRALIEGEPASAVVVINADFTDERPLFSLQEYIAYADSEIRRSKRWVEKSQELPDGGAYSFPWQKVDGDVRLEGVPPQPLRFELDRGKLLDLLVGHTLYNEPTVAIRELLQNAIDAVRYQGLLDQRKAHAQNQNIPPLGKVLVEWKPDTRVLSIADNGTGMDRDIIAHHLMNVGSSYYNTPTFETEYRDFVPISRFGIGILTCFMVSDDVEIVTFKNLRGYRIRMTSVKSTYLLREIESGDELLHGLEPHGTRVKLRLRDTVDLSERTVLDILRHWIILPECTVEYRESGGAPVAVGFGSAAEALRNYLTEEGNLDTAPNWKVDVIVKSRAHQSLDSDSSTGLCELAFGVTSSWFPERSFAGSPAARLPKVCIEGIRVAEEVPGFENAGGQGLGALLAVRGLRKFRTTVSRNGLEVDDVYRKVARLCGEMLFEHIQDEAERISQLPGKPLSQAAAASMYLIQSLTMAGRGGTIVTNLDELSKQQRSIVIERVDSEEQKTTTKRSLISPNELRNVPEFWTLESRSVDSLGLISLDLGRELSLNEFLLALAPDVTQLRYSPILPDARRSKEAIRISHRPQSVEFSRRYQQTAIKWMPQKGHGECGLRLRELISKDRLEAINAVIYQSDFRRIFRTSYGFHIAVENLNVDSAPISGDDPQVVAVAGRIGVVLKENSALHGIWDVLRTAVVRLSHNGSIEDAAMAISLATAFSRIISIHESDDERSLFAWWREQMPHFRPILNKLDLKHELPQDLISSIDRDTIFNAAIFWRDWNEGFES